MQKGLYISVYILQCKKGYIVIKKVIIMPPWSERELIDRRYIACSLWTRNKMVSKKLKENFKRKFKSVKKSEYYYNCRMCGKDITPATIYVLDTRNDKYCSKCAQETLGYQLDEIKAIQAEIKNKEMLDTLEEEEPPRVQSHVLYKTLFNEIFKEVEKKCLDY